MVNIGAYGRPEGCFRGDKRVYRVFHRGSGPWPPNRGYRRV